MRKTVCGAAAIVAMTWVAAAAEAQTAPVDGVVRDAEGRPLAHAQVLVLPGASQAVTGTDGRFRVRLAPGTYRVHVALIGYAPAVRDLRLVAGGARPELEVRLATTPLTLGGIDVTASPLARQPSAVAASTSQLSGRSLERELSGTIAQTLKYQPGVAVRSNGPAASMPVLRGLTGDRVLVLQDGQRAADLAGSADDHGVTIDPLTARRVEVVRGPATLLYGNNALGGVVNVISGDVSDGVPLRPEFEFAAQSESAYPGGAASARASVPVGGVWSVTARGGVRRAGDMRIGTDPVLGDRLSNTDLSSVNGAFTVSRSGDVAASSLAVRVYDFAYGIPVPPGTGEVDLRGGRVEIAARADLDTRRTLFPAARADATMQHYAHDELDEDGVVQQRFELDTRTANLLVRQAELGPFREGAWGASVLIRDYAATGPSALTPGADSDAFGVFAFQELGLGAVALQLGARADRYRIASRSSEKFGDGVTRTFDAVSASVGVSVAIATAVTGSLTASRSFRAPTVEELFSGAPHAGTGSVEYGDAALREERGHGAEALVRLRTARLNGQFAAYINRIDDYIQPVYQRDTMIAGVPTPVYRYAQAQATLRGVEGSLELAVTPVVLLAVRGDWLRAAQADGTPLSFMPPPRVGVTVRWDNGRFALGGDVHHERAQHNTGSADEGITDAHTIMRVDAAVRAELFGRPHSLTLRVDNIGNVLHREATSRIRDFAPAAGRNIALGWRVRF